MDHRCSERHPICLPIQISSKKLGIIDVFVENISVEGVFINLAEHDLFINSVIKVHLQVVDQLLELSSYVVHKNNNGAGLLFEYFIPLDGLFYPPLTCIPKPLVAMQ